MLTHETIHSRDVLRNTIKARNYMKILNLIILTGLIISCNFQTRKNKQENSIQPINDSINNNHIVLNKTKPTIDYLEVVGDSIIIPAFEIEVLLNEKAEKKIKLNKETVVVKAIFFGDPIENLPKKYHNDGVIGGIVLLTYPLELRDKRIAKFENLKFSKELYDLLANKDISLLINVFSSRNSTELNLLSCGIIQDTMSEIIGKRLTINCKLIDNN